MSSQNNVMENHAELISDIEFLIKAPALKPTFMFCLMRSLIYSSSSFFGALAMEQLAKSEISVALIVLSSSIGSFLVDIPSYAILKEIEINRRLHTNVCSFSLIEKMLKYDSLVFLKLLLGAKVMDTQYKDVLLCSLVGIPGVFLSVLGLFGLAMCCGFICREPDLDSEDDLESQVEHSIQL